MCILWEDNLFYSYAVTNTVLNREKKKKKEKEKQKGKKTTYFFILKL